MLKITCPNCKTELEPTELITNPRKMAQAVGDMATSLEKDQEKLIKLNIELEDRVLMRIRQLKSIANERQKTLEEVSAQLNECKSQLLEKDKRIIELTSFMK